MISFLQSSGFQIVMLAMLAFATLSFTLLAMVTVSNAWRLRNPLITWRCGKLFGYPLFASIFLAFTITAGFVLYFSGLEGMLPAMLCYTWIAITWLFSSDQMSKRYITDNGIVKNVNDPSQTIVWSGITDYLDKQVKGGKIYIFFYMQPATAATSRQVNRVELFVPDSRLVAFQKLLDFKLRRRFVQTTAMAAGYQQIN
jgi:hypothetical protein